MPKIAITITSEMDKALRRQSGKTGAPVAEIARRAIARELRRMGEKVTWEVAWGGPREDDEPGQPQGYDHVTSHTPGACEQAQRQQEV